MTEFYDDIATPQRTQQILKKHGFRLKKSLGQNFLTNLDILKEIVAAGEVNPEDDIIEIGPGIGALTEQLAKRAHSVLSFEIDERLLPVLKETLSPYDNITIIPQDILKADLATIVSEQFDGKHPIKIVANLPYYITTPIMLHLIESGLTFERMVVMMQKEVAQRLAAQPGSKAYGSLTIAVQLRMAVTIPFTVPRTAFVPQPNVDSAIVSLVQRQAPLVEITDFDNFDKLIKGCFAQRRKSLWNNLQNLFGRTDAMKETLQTSLKQAEIDPKSRAEQLSIQQFATLSVCIQDNLRK